MSRAELKRALLVAGAFIFNPPGWIPAWTTLAFVVTCGWLLQAAALSPSIDIARVQAATEIYRKTVDMYVTTLSVWLGYRGIGGIVEAARAVYELRAQKGTPP